MNQGFLQKLARRSNVWPADAVGTVKPREGSEDSETSNVVQHVLAEEHQNSDTEPDLPEAEELDLPVQEENSDEETFFTPLQSPCPSPVMPPLFTSSEESDGLDGDEIEETDDEDIYDGLWGQFSRHFSNK